MLKGEEIVKRDGRVGLHLLHERSDIGLILKGQLHLGCCYGGEVKGELEFKLLYIVLSFVLNDLGVLRTFPVIYDHFASICAILDTLLFELELQFLKALACTVPGNQEVGGLEPDTY